MNLEFGKDKTAIIKGVAILMMIVLHCSMPGNWDTPLREFSNKSFVWYSQSLKLCVGIYTFMVGYGYAFSKDKDWKYSLKHIGKLLIPFWIILGIFTLPVCYKSIGGGKLLVLNAIGINSELNWFSWFVAFYIFAMIVMPFVGRLIDRKPILWSIVSITCFYGIGAALNRLYPSYTENDWLQRLFDCCMHTPCMILAYLCARKNWIQKIQFPDSKWMSLGALVLLMAVLFTRRHLGSVLGFNFDFFYAPIFIVAILVIANQVNCTPLSNVFVLLGKTSVYMWFFHALFFTQATRNIYQPFVAISDHLWVNTIWTIVLTFLCSWTLMKAEGGFEKLVIRKHTAE